MWMVLMERGILKEQEEKSNGVVGWVPVERTSMEVDMNSTAPSRMALPPRMLE
jgi:hypothetical protein